MVGWDNPLSTYFAQVSRDDADDGVDAFLLWLGTEPQEVRCPQDLIEPLAPDAVLTGGTIEQLSADRAACLDRAPTFCNARCSMRQEAALIRHYD